MRLVIPADSLELQTTVLSLGLFPVAGLLQLFSDMLQKGLTSVARAREKPP